MMIFMHLLNVLKLYITQLTTNKTASSLFINMVPKEMKKKERKKCILGNKQNNHIPSNSIDLIIKKKKKKEKKKIYNSKNIYSVSNH